MKTRTPMEMYHDPMDLASCILSVANRNGSQEEIDGFTEDLEMAMFGEVAGCLTAPVASAVTLWKAGRQDSAMLDMDAICGLFTPPED